MSDRHRGIERSIDRHFRGRTQLDEERRMREHLGGCPSCRAHYERRLVFASLDPRALQRRERLGRPFGLGAPREGERAGWRWQAWGLTAGAAAACALALLLISSPVDPDAGFTARGGESPSELWLFRISEGSAPQRLQGSMRHDDELAVAVLNGAAKPWLLVFARDEHDHVYWYAPTWTDAAQEPRALPLEPKASPVELPFSVLHELDGDTLTLYGLFSERELSVREVEAALAGRGAAEAEAWLREQGELVVRSVRVTSEP